MIFCDDSSRAIVNLQGSVHAAEVAISGEMTKNCLWASKEKPKPANSRVKTTLKTMPFYEGFKMNKAGILATAKRFMAHGDRLKSIHSINVSVLVSKKYVTAFNGSYL